MRTWIRGLAIALGVASAACNSERATCKRLLHHGMECSKDLQAAPAGSRDMDLQIADKMIDGLCAKSDVTDQAGKLAVCLDEPSCDAFNACLAKIEGPGHGLVPVP